MNSRSDHEPVRQPEGKDPGRRREQVASAVNRGSTHIDALPRPRVSRSHLVATGICSGLLGLGVVVGVGGLLLVLAGATGSKGQERLLGIAVPIALVSFVTCGWVGACFGYTDQLDRFGLRRNGRHLLLVGLVAPFLTSWFLLLLIPRFSFGLSALCAAVLSALACAVGVKIEDYLSPYPLQLARPVHVAVARGDTESVKRLMQTGYAVYLGDAGGRTPLHLAAQRHDPDMIRLLLRHGAQANAVTGKGETALHLAVPLGAEPAASGAERFRATVSALVEAGANVEAKTEEGKTAASLAQDRGFGGAAQVLRSLGAEQRARSGWASPKWLRLSVPAASLLVLLAFSLLALAVRNAVHFGAWGLLIVVGAMSAVVAGGYARLLARALLTRSRGPQTIYELNKWALLYGLPCHLLMPFLLVAIVLNPTGGGMDEKHASAATKGKIAGGVYSNQFFGFTLPLPADWDVIPEADMPDLTDAAIGLMSGGSEAQRRALEQARGELRMLLVLATPRPEPGSPPERFASIVVGVLNISEMPEAERRVFDGIAFLRAMSRDMVQQDFARVAGEVQPLRLGGRPFHWLDIDLDLGMVAGRQRNLASVVKNHVFMISLTSTSQTGLDEAMRIVEKCRFE